MIATLFFLCWSLADGRALDHLQALLGLPSGRWFQTEKQGDKKEDLQAVRAEVAKRVIDLIPNLGDDTKSPFELFRATYVAVSIPAGNELAPALVPFLYDDIEVRADFAAWVLTCLGPNADSVAGDLVKALDAPGARKGLVAQVLGSFGARAEKAVPRLKKMLADTDPDVRAGAALALWKIDKNSKDAVPALIGVVTELKKPADEQTAAYAITALGEIGAEAKDAVPALLDILKDGEWALQFRAAVALVKIEDSDRGARFLSKHIEDDDIPPNLDSRIEAAVALLNCRAHAKQATQLLVRYSDGKDSEGRVPTALTFLTATALPREEVVALLKGALTDSSPLTRQFAVLTLGKIGKTASPALEAVTRLKDDQDEYVRWQAIDAIRRIKAE